MRKKTWFCCGTLGIGVVVLFVGFAMSQSTRRLAADGSERVGVVIHGGYETDPRDGGRPVRLVAAALGVEEQVFRDVFKDVRPARGRGPTGEEARRNKQVLMAGLSKYGVTNDRLDEVSNYYRYRPQNGELWRHQGAEIEAIVRSGKVVGFDIVGAGAGYSTPPTIEVPGVDGRWVATVGYGKELKTNGAITGVVADKSDE